MRIGILTFHRALNYGAILQAYALQNYLKLRGQNAHVLDYRNNAIETIYHSNIINLHHLEQYKKFKFTLKNRLKRTVEIVYMHVLEKKFLSFLESNQMITNPILTLNDLLIVSDAFDYIITGSDQVWNLELSDNDMAYFLKNIPEKKRLSYAASAGGYRFQKNYDCIKCLTKFSALSVREKDLINCLKRYGIKNIYSHMDPIFLLNLDKWESMAKITRCHRKYILVFSMNTSNDLIDIALKYKKDKNLDIYFLSTSLKRSLKRNVKQIWFASPKEFLGWIKNAEYVFTDSFHGTAFAILFNKKFYSHTRENTSSNNRIENLLSYFSLNEYNDVNKIGLVDKYAKIEKFQEIRNEADKYFYKYLV